MNCIIVDDDKFSQEALQMLVEDHAPELTLLKVCSTAKDAIRSIGVLQPELVFLDVEMPGMTGFEMLEEIENINFKIIFTTAHEHYALKAIRFAALDYLIKPIGPDEFKKAVKRFIDSHEQTESPRRIQMLLKSVQQPKSSLNKIALPSTDGLVFVLISDIVRCQSDSNYTTFHLAKDVRYVVSKTLKDYEELLSEHNFFRIHASHLVNLNKIKKYVRGEGGYVVMEDGTTVDVSSRKKPEFLKRLETL